jgi:hypothetical protein
MFRYEGIANQQKIGADTSDLRNPGRIFLTDNITINSRWE